MKRTVLNIDDSLDDILLLRRACRKAGVAFDLRVVEQSALAIDYLAGTGAYADRSAHPLPDVILLDLKMPGKSGFEVLEWIEASPALQGIFVAMFSSSTNEDDVQNAKRLGADCYMVKPLDYGALTGFVRCLDAALREEPPAVLAALSKLPECRNVEAQT